jgi:hypothetical protein
MEFFHRQFDQRKPAPSRGQILLVLYLQIMLVAISALNLGIFTVLLAGDLRRGDPNGVVKLFACDIAGFSFMILISAFGIRRSIRRLLAAPTPTP